MDNVVSELIDITESSKISFSETYYKSLDSKTIMGEVPFKEIIFLEYRDTEAGSNPREYVGLKKTNKNILHSLLTDSESLFRFLHTGIILCLTSEQQLNSVNRSIRYEECCLTNGNQTRFIILIITLLKLHFKENEITPITLKKYNTFIRDTFGDSEAVMSILDWVKFKSVSEINKAILNSTKYRSLFNNLNIESFLNSRIRIQINLLNSMVEDLDDKLDAYTVGTNIAQANNDTQNVKADDIFGNKNKNELNRYIFKDFIEEYSSKIQIEYKYGEVDEKKHKKIHILPLLRLIIPTEILTKETDIYKFTNQRLPIYNIFSKLFNQIKKNNEKAIRAAEIISRLVPLLYKIRINYVEPSLFKLRRDLNRYYTKKAYEGDLKKTIIGKDIDEAKGDNAQIEKIANRITRYNIEHVLPVVIYRIRNLFKVNIDGKLALNIPTENTENFIESLTEVIYTRYIEIKLKGVQSSLTTEVRDESFYKLGYECYTSNIRILKINGTDFIEKNKYYIR